MRIAGRTYVVIALFSVYLLLAFASVEVVVATADPKQPSIALTKRLASLLGPADAAAVSDPDGHIVAGVNADRLLIPASILKLLTGLSAMHYLGENYRFPTDIYLNPQNSLVIKGYGDPLIISERIEEMALRLAIQIEGIDHLLLDDTHFSHPIVIPGRHTTAQPYDAPNGALCVNFNTVFFKKERGKWVSAEPQTPLLPFALSKIKGSGLKSGRITLATDRSEILKYSGELFAFFLKRAGISIEGEVTTGVANSEKDRLLLHYEAPARLREVVADLLEFSNNFIANQLMLAMGATAYGPPATVDKGLRALRSYYADVLGIKTGRIEEASGISRGNRISAEVMLQMLSKFEPYRRLMRREGRQWYKTGHLKGVRTRAGYIDRSEGGHYRFVVMINTPGRGTDRIMRIIEETLK